MLNEKFVEAITAQAVKASGASILSIACDPRNGYLVQGGTATPISLHPAPRAHEVLTLADIAEAATAWEAHRCFHNSGEIVLVLDDDDRHDRVTMSLIHSPQWLVLQGFTQPKTMSHKEIVKLLRITFKGCVDATFISRIRGINFTALAEGDSYVQPGMEKVGKAIQNKIAMQDNGSIPEEIPLSIPVYTNQGLTQRFATSLAIDIDAASQQFTVQTPPGELTQIQNAITEQIHEQLTAALLGTTVFRGSP